VSRSSRFGDRMLWELRGERVKPRDKCVKAVIINDILTVCNSDLTYTVR